jgi:epoxyqueuosine reductase QueG
MFLRNAAIAAGNGRDPALRAALERLAGHPSDLVGEAARTALRQLTNSLKS